MLVKICGLTRPEEAEYLNKNGADFAGFVLFFPKSKRNITIEKAKEIMAHLDGSVKTAAVTVAPGAHEITQIAEAGFDYIQIHGEISDNLFRLAAEKGLKVLKAFNVSDIDRYGHFRGMKEISGYVLDAAAPGSGKTFDWTLASQLPRDDRLFILAGGLTPGNVSEAAALLHPDAVDVSSGVEYDAAGPGTAGENAPHPPAGADADVTKAGTPQFYGKDPAKVAAFIQNAKKRIHGNI